MARDTSRIRKLARPTGNQAVHVFDDGPRQLSIRVTSAEAKSFVFAGKLNKAPLRIIIGDVKMRNIDDARRLQTLIDQGIDPRQEKADKLAANEAKKAADEAAKREAERIESLA